MRIAWLVAFIVALAWTAPTQTQEKKDKITLNGIIMCAKCSKLDPALEDCQTVIQVKEAGKDVVYYLKDKGRDEAYQPLVCGGGRKPATVTGKLSVDKDGKKWITPSAVRILPGK